MPGREGRRIWDVSPVLSPETPVWPGDTPLRVRRLASILGGERVNLATVETTVHLGAHADAPSHFEAGAKGIGEVDLLPYLGPCRLIEVLTRDRIRPEDLGGRFAGAERVLVRTRGPGAGDPFREGFASLDPAAVELLGAAGILLFGSDAPSVDLLESKELPSHHALLRFGIAILEGLELAGVPEGDYELIALPLRFAGLDGSPVRAVLREM